MVNRVGGALELIGLRAVILDIRQYGNSGRQIEATNAAIGKSTQKAQDASNQFAAAQTKAIAASKASAVAASNSINAARAFAAAQQAETKAVNELAAAETRLAAARANAAKARPQGINPVTGRQGFISRAQAEAEVTAAETGVATATVARDAATASMLRNKVAAADYAKAQKLAASEATKAAATQSAADKLRISSNERLAASEAKLAGIQKTRLKAVTGAAAIATGVGVAAVGAGAISAASKYETTLAKINILTEATDEQTKELGQAFLTMSKTLPNTPDELGASAYAVLSSGIKDVNTALKVTELSAKASAIGLGESKDVARVVTATLNAYKGTGLEAAQVTDILVAAVQQGSAEASDFAQSLGRVIPVASNLGVGFDELAATIAALTNAGLDTSEATTGVLGILNQLQKSTPDAEEALAGVGLTIEGIRKSIQDKGFVATMQDLAVAFQGNTSAIRPLLPEVRGLNAFVSAFIVQGKNASDILGNIRKEGGITERGFAEMSKTFGFQADLLKNQLNVAMIQIGTAILPTVTTALKDLITWIDKNQESIKKFVTDGLELAIEIIKDFATGIGLIIDALAWIPANEQGIVTAVAAIGAAFAWALPGGPILKGLLLMTAILGDLSKEGGKGDKAAQKLNDLFGLGQKGTGISPDQLRAQTEKSGSIEGAVKALIGDAGGFGEALAADFINNLKAQGFDTSKGVKEFDRALEHLNNPTLEKTNIEIPKISRNVGEVSKKATEAEGKLKKLAEAYKSSSEAAGQIETVASKLKLFGDLSKDLADALGLSATAAGNIQGFDAVKRSMERADREAFDFTATLATVASAFQQSASVARNIVLELARSAQQASQQALDTVLSRPTREVADLGVPLARSRQQETFLAFRNNPQIDALNNQLKSIDRAMRDLDRQSRQAQKQAREAEKAARRREEERRRQVEQQNRIMEAQLDALQFANLLARHAYERQQEQMEDLISANKKAFSTLESNFRKTNGEFQKQINAAIGQGDSDTALSLVEQQRQATKTFRNQRTGLTDEAIALEAQKKAAERAEAERQRQAAVAEALLEQQQKATKANQDNTESTDENTEATDAQSEAIEAQKDKLNEQRQAIQDQIDALQAEKDAQAQNTARIQETIDLYQSQVEVLRALGVQADKTLLTQEQQWQLAKKLIEQIAFESGLVRDLSGGFEKMIPEVVEANRQFGLLKEAARVLADDSFRATLIDKGIDPATKQLEIFAIATAEAGAAQKKATEDINNATGEFTKKAAEAAQHWMTEQEQILVDSQNGMWTATDIFKGRVIKASNDVGSALQKVPAKFESAVKEIYNQLKNVSNALSPKSLINSLKGLLPKYAIGGFTPVGGGAFPAILHPNELVLPLDDKNRVNELLNAIGGATSSAGARGSTGPGSSSATGTLSRSAPAPGPFDDLSSSLQRAEQMLRDEFIRLGYSQINFGRGLEPVGSMSGGARGLTGPGPSSSTGSFSSSAASVPTIFTTANVSPSMVAQMSGGQSTGTTFAPTWNIQGESLETMRAMAIREVDNAFRSARTVSSRSGSLLTQGIGPGVR